MPFSCLSIGLIFFLHKEIQPWVLESKAAGLLLGSWGGLQLIWEIFKYLKDVQTKGFCYPPDEITLSKHREATRGPRIDPWADINVRDRTVQSRPHTIARKKAMDNSVSNLRFMSLNGGQLTVDKLNVEIPTCWLWFFFIVGNCVSISI